MSNILYPDTDILLTNVLYEDVIIMYHEVSRCKILDYDLNILHHDIYMYPIFIMVQTSWFLNHMT